MKLSPLDVVFESGEKTVITSSELEDAGSYWAWNQSRGFHVIYVDEVTL